MINLHPYAGLAACNPGREARFRRDGLLIKLRWLPDREWEVRVWGPKGVTPAQLEAIARALGLDHYTVESSLSPADFTTYVYLLRGGCAIPPELQAEYEHQRQLRKERFNPTL